MSLKKLLLPLQISPTTVTLKAGESQKFTLSPEAVVAWTIEGDGIINQEGVYTAPTGVSQSHSVTVRATDGSGRPANATVNLTGNLLCGDVDLNGKLSVGDAIIVLKAAVNQISLTETQKNTADIDKNGKITVGDVIKILRMIIKLDPVCEL